ncbi:protoporphyrinogen oxidase [Pedococcus sp. NPDC057267]|uniref:protoporphyrinogen oxidase n=1 Tax=Pedococcus sp. NPDC057267 TaxID=3346077 RepID=UPI003643EB32
MLRSRVVVIGGGISGLACAWALTRADAAVSVTVLDASDRPGGKLRREPVAGFALDVGAESVLARRPEAIALMDEVGLAGHRVHPATTSASIWSRGELQPMPKGTLMGIPSTPASAAGILSPDEVARLADEQPWTGGDFDDVSVGDYVAARLGDAVVDRLVEPLLGGVYAGQARSLSLRACLPQVFEAARRGGSLLGEAAAAAARAAAANEAAVTASASSGSAPVPVAGSGPTPVFAGLEGGIGRLAEVLTEQLRAEGVEVRSETIAREVAPRPESEGGGWSVVVGPRTAPERLLADAVVLATPALPTSRLLTPHAPAAARELGDIPYASMAIVTLAVGVDDAQDAARHLPGSGFLVPATEGRTIKASTFTSSKWGWVAQTADDLVFLRASVGRYGETSDLQRPDNELEALAVAEVSEALGHPLPRLVDAHVQRWGGALPQYTVGHVDRVSRIRAGVASLPGLEVAGAAYDGVGIPACVASGRAAAEAVLTHLRTRAEQG